MSSAKRTPRYVDVIRPFEVADGGRAAEVIQLRPELLLPKLPPITEAWPRAKAVPVSRRPWQLLLVPPTPGAPTRSFHVARWQARLVAIAAGTVLVVACAGVTAFVVALQSPNFFAARNEAALLRARLVVVEDSLALARVALEAPDVVTADVTATAPTVVASAVTGPKPAARLAPPPARAATRRAPAPVPSDEPSAEVAGGQFEGLPVIGAIASRFSRARRHPLLKVIRPHLGVDVAARRGTKITAPAPGRVSFVGRKFGFGLVLEIQHSNGVKTRYAHCGSALIAEGARVERGTPIATVGTSGLSTGPHLHYEVLVNGHQVDPLRFRMPQMTDSTAAQAASTPRTAVSAAPVPALTPAGVTSATPGTTPIPPVVTSPAAPAAAPHPAGRDSASPK
jgi:murein DD-endopeptidase MepM/ murein hydrolase activator NlpD